MNSRITSTKITQSTSNVTFSKRKVNIDDQKQEEIDHIETPPIAPFNHTKAPTPLLSPESKLLLPPNPYEGNQQQLKNSDPQALFPQKKFEDQNFFKLPH